MTWKTTGFIIELWPPSRTMIDDAWAWCQSAARRWIDLSSTRSVRACSSKATQILRRRMGRGGHWERASLSWRSASFSADPSLDRTGIESQAKVTDTHTKYIMQCSKAIDRQIDFSSTCVFMHACEVRFVWWSGTGAPGRPVLLPLLALAFLLIWCVAGRQAGRQAGIALPICHGWLAGWPFASSWSHYALCRSCLIPCWILWGRHLLSGLVSAHINNKRTGWQIHDTFLVSLSVVVV